MRSDFDLCFESAFCGDKQMQIMHKYQIDGDIWHICTIDSNDYYHSGYWRFDRTEWTFTAVAPRQHVPVCV